MPLLNKGIYLETLCLATFAYEANQTCKMTERFSHNNVFKEEKMSNYPNIQIFTKPGCPYCTRAKAVLDEAGLPYTQHDVTATQRNADISIYASGMATVPQIFIGDYHINGAEDLEQLQRSGHLAQLVETVGNSTLSVQDISDEAARRGAEDWTLRQVVSATDGSRSDDPEAWALLRFYKGFFGFWPNTFAYLNHWPEAYKLFVYCHNFSAVGHGKKALGPLNMFTVGYSTSEAHGCNYCQVHSAATGGEQSLKAVRQFKEAKAGKRSEDNPYGELELAIAQLAAEATRNAVSDDTLSKIRQLSESPEQAQAFITGVEMMVAAFGFLNVFNDLTGLELEGQWAKQASEQAGVEAGRHSASQAENPSNLDYEIPSGGPSIEEMLAKYGKKIEDLETYCQSEFGVVPNWVQCWPQQLQRLHVYLYSELMGERSHTLVSSELKHLMARVSAIAKGHDYLAAVEGFIAHYNAENKSRSIERIRHCFAAAVGRTTHSDLFSEKEKAALQFAWLSAQMPLTTPREFVRSAVENYSEKELIHLIVTCSVASLVQRFVAIAQPELEGNVSSFLQQHNLESKTLNLRYPLSEAKVAQLAS